MPKKGIKRITPSRASAKAPRSSLADALFAGTQQRLLALLFGQPYRSFYATELIGLANAGSGAVQRELARLSQSGLLTVTLLGQAKEAFLTRVLAQPKIWLMGGEDDLITACQDVGTKVDALVPPLKA